MSCEFVCWGAFCVFFFNDTATTEIYTLSLHDALPISPVPVAVQNAPQYIGAGLTDAGLLELRRRHANLALLKGEGSADRKSTRLNSSHANISYAVFCLKKKNTDTSI